MMTDARLEAESESGLTERVLPIGPALAFADSDADGRTVPRDHNLPMQTSSAAHSAEPAHLHAPAASV